MKSISLEFEDKNADSYIIQSQQLFANMLVMIGVEFENATLNETDNEYDIEPVEITSQVLVLNIDTPICSFNSELFLIVSSIPIVTFVILVLIVSHVAFVSKSQFGKTTKLAQITVVYMYLMNAFTIAVYFHLNLIPYWSELTVQLGFWVYMVKGCLHYYYAWQVGEKWDLVKKLTLYSAGDGLHLLLAIEVFAKDIEELKIIKKLKEKYMIWYMKFIYFWFYVAYPLIVVIAGEEQSCDKNKNRYYLLRTAFISWSYALQYFFVFWKLYSDKGQTNALLMIAIDENDFDKFQRVLKRTSNIPDERVLFGHTFLTYACYKNHELFVKELLLKNTFIDVNVPCISSKFSVQSSNPTPLFCACYHGNLDIIERLDKKNCNFSTESGNEWFIELCKKDHWRCIKYFCHNRKCMSKVFIQNDPLFFACCNKNHRSVITLGMCSHITINHLYRILYTYIRCENRNYILDDRIVQSMFRLIYFKGEFDDLQSLNEYRYKINFQNETLIVGFKDIITRIHNDLFWEDEELINDVTTKQKRGESPVMRFTNTLSRRFFTDRSPLQIPMLANATTTTTKTKTATTTNTNTNTNVNAANDDEIPLLVNLIEDEEFEDGKSKVSKFLTKLRRKCKNFDTLSLILNGSDMETLSILFDTNELVKVDSRLRVSLLSDNTGVRSGEYASPLYARGTVLPTITANELDQKNDLLSMDTHSGRHIPKLSNESSDKKSQKNSKVNFNSNSNSNASSNMNSKKNSMDERIQISEWYLGKVLGKGGFGWVHEGISRTDENKIVALKFIPKDKNRPFDKKLINAEIGIYREIGSKNGNIIELQSFNLNAKYPLGTGHGSINSNFIDAALLVFKFAPHGTMNTEFMDKLKTTEKKEHFEAILRSYFHDLIQVLEVCHKERIIHRDLKPDNLLLDKNFQLKVSDFGVAKMLDISIEYNDDIRVTDKLRNVGTLGYIAPEVQLGCEYNSSCDIFSAGVILFDWYFGKEPFGNAHESDSKYKFVIQSKKSEFYKANGIEMDKYVGNSQNSIIDLIWKMITFNPLTRITIEEIKQHTWYKGEIYDAEKLSRSVVELVGFNYDLEVRARTDETTKLNLNDRIITRVATGWHVQQRRDVSNPLIVVIGIGEYDDEPNLIGVETDYIRIKYVFHEVLGYAIIYQNTQNKTIYCKNRNEIYINNAKESIGEISNDDNSFKLHWDSEIDPENDDVDFMDPGEHGDFLLKIRQVFLENNHDCLIIIVSSHGDEEDGFDMIAFSDDEYHTIESFMQPFLDVKVKTKSMNDKKTDNTEFENKPQTNNNNKNNNNNTDSDSSDEKSNDNGNTKDMDAFRDIPKIMIVDACRGRKRPTLPSKSSDNDNSKHDDSSTSIIGNTQRMTIEHKHLELDINSGIIPIVTRGTKLKGNKMFSKSNLDRMANFHLWRHIFANPKHFATVDGGDKGGYLIRGLCSTMLNKQYAFSKDLSCIVDQIRLKTKEKTGCLATNSVEDVNVIPYKIYFQQRQ